MGGEARNGSLTAQMFGLRCGEAKFKLFSGQTSFIIHRPTLIFLSLQWTRTVTSCTFPDLGKTLCVFVYHSVCLRFPTKWFLLEARQTATETVVWHGRTRESERMRDRRGRRGGSRGGKVDCASVQPSPSFPQTRGKQQ